MKVVYIDSQNIHKWIFDYHWWIIDWKHFFVYLKDKYKVDKVKIFFWFIKEQKWLYFKLEKIWYEVCFKETLILPNGNVKWNVDIDIAIFVLRDYYENNISFAYLVTWDWDYNSLVDFLEEKNVFWKVFVPWVSNTSVLLRKSAKKKLVDLVPMKNKLQKEKLSTST